MEERRPMHVIVAPVLLLLLALLHAPPQAQALFFDFLPADLVQLGASEPVTLALTGLTLLSLARLSAPSERGARSRAPEAAPPAAVPKTLPTSVERAA
jgi:hypothetical protein